MPLRIIATAGRLSELGYWPLLIRPGGKQPTETFKDRGPLERDELVWRLRDQPRLNIAIRLGGLIALDADDDEAMDVLSTFPESPITQRTPKGGEHRLYRLPEGREARCRQRVAGVRLDVKTGVNAYLMFSPSEVNSCKYELLGELVGPRELPALDPAPLRREEERIWPPPAPVGREIERVRRYVARIVARNHAGAHNACYRAACKLADAGLNETDVFRELSLWNHTNAVDVDGSPYPFSVAELWHKARDAVSRRR